VKRNWHISRVPLSINLRFIFRRGVVRSLSILAGAHQLRYPLIVFIGLLLAALAVSIFGGIATVNIIIESFEGGEYNAEGARLLSIELIEMIDLFLLGTIMMITSVGLFLAMIPPALLALLEFGPVKALLVVAGFLLIDAVVENVVKPKFLGESLNIAPVVIILSLIFWAAVLGPMGALLAVPLTLAIKELVLETDEDNQWVAELMSSGEDAEAPDDAASEDKPEIDAEGNA
jgi:hypothetical protein